MRLPLDLGAAGPFHPTCFRLPPRHVCMRERTLDPLSRSLARPQANCDAMLRTAVECAERRERGERLDRALAHAMSLPAPWRPPRAREVLALNVCM